MMRLDQDYVIYAVEASLTLLALSAAYMVEVSRPITLLFLIPVTLLFGYTAYISRERFMPQAAISLISLIFLPLGGIVAAVAVVVTVGNFMISIFSGGDSFRDYYGATTLPLLLAGLVLGVSIFGLISTNNEFRDTARTEASEFLGSQADYMISNTNLVQGQKQKQAKVVNQTSENVFRGTKSSVISYMAKNSTINSSEYIKLEEGFGKAERDVKERIKTLNAMKIGKESPDISKRVESLVKEKLEGRTLLLVVPAMAFGLYSFHPLIGLLTALWAVMFSTFDRRLSKDQYSKELDASQ